MAQKITGYIKLQIPAGKATPAPPVGPALGQKGVNTKPPPAPLLSTNAAVIDPDSGVPNKNKVGSITLAQAEEIAKTKMPDLNAASLEAAVSMIKGTCRSMGVTVEG